MNMLLHILISVVTIQRMLRGREQGGCVGVGWVGGQVSEDRTLELRPEVGVGVGFHSFSSSVLPLLGTKPCSWDWE